MCWRHRFRENDAPATNAGARSESLEGSKDGHNDERGREAVDDAKDINGIDLRADDRN